jgi:hypothetical protein
VGWFNDIDANYNIYANIRQPLVGAGLDTLRREAGRESLGTQTPMKHSDIASLMVDEFNYSMVQQKMPSQKAKYQFNSGAAHGLNY